MVFLGDIAFYMGVLVFASGIYMIHHANHHDSGEKCKLLRAGGYIVMTISLLGLLCTGYFWIKYYFDGAYDKPTVSHMINSQQMNMAHAQNRGMGKMQQCMGKMSGMVMGPDTMKHMQGCMHGDENK